MSQPSALRTLVLASLALSLLFSATAVAAEDERGWRWAVAPYLWLPSVSGDTSFPDRDSGSGDDVEVSAGDILENLEFAALVRLTGMSEKWGFLSDASYLGLGKRSEGDTADIDIDTLFVELVGAYRPNEHVDLLFGARYWDLGFEIDIDDPLRTDVDLNSDWVDPIIGVRFHAPMGEHWAFMARGDLGGFGVGSDFTWNVELAAIWNATESFSLALGYRHMALEESIDTRFEDIDIDLALSGPEFGFLFRF